MIADFGLSRVLEEEKLQVLTEICGTPGVSLNSCIYAMPHIVIYMKPEIYIQLCTVHGPRNLQEE